MNPFDWKSSAPTIMVEPKKRGHRKGGMDRNITDDGYRYKSEPVRVYLLDGSSHWYPNLSAAARGAGINKRTAQDHLKSGKPFDGFTFIACGWEK